MLIFKDICLAQRLQPTSGEVSDGQFVHILGANGAGKSTLLSLLAGLIQPDSGSIMFQGHDIHQLSLQELASKRCYQEQKQSTQFDLTVWESLRFFADLKGIPEELEQGLEIQRFLARKLNTLSGGENRRVHIARVLMQIWPALQQGRGVVFLDEPIQGLDFRHQHLLFNLLKWLTEQGNIVIVSHHELNLCYAYAHYVWLMQEGNITFSGNKTDVMTESNLQETFACEIDVLTHNEGLLFRTYLN